MVRTKTSQSLAKQTDVHSMFRMFVCLLFVHVFKQINEKYNSCGQRHSRSQYRGLMPVLGNICQFVTSLDISENLR